MNIENTSGNWRITGRRQYVLPKADYSNLIPNSYVKLNRKLIDSRCTSVDNCHSTSLPDFTNKAFVKAEDCDDTNLEHKSEQCSGVKEAGEGDNVDKGWAWIILFSAFLNFFLIGILNTTGVFHLMFLDRYGQSNSDTSWTGALAIGLCNICAPIGSIITTVAGPRVTIFIGAILISCAYILSYFATSLAHIIVTYGIMQGIGLSLTFYGSLVTLGFYFERYRNFAYGIALTGIAIGTMVFPILINYLFDLYGMHGTLLITGAIQMNNFVVGALTRPIHCSYGSQREVTELHAENNETSTDELRDSPDTTFEKQIYDVKIDNESVKSNKPYPSVFSKSFTRFCKYFNILKELLVLRFIAYCLNLVLAGMALHSIYVQFPAFLKSLGVSTQFTSTLFTAMGVASLLCRIIIGVATNNRNHARTLAVYIGGCLTAGIVCIIAPYICVHLIGQVAFAAMFSFFGNVYQVLMSPVVIDLMGLERSVLTTGIALLMVGLGSLAGPPISGLFVDITGTYFYVFLFNGLSYIAGGVIMLAVPIDKRLRRDSTEMSNINEDTKL